MTTRTTIDEYDLSGSLPSAVEGLHVLVIAPDLFAALPLPTKGSLLMGRTAKADLRLEDPSASRQHARLYVGETLAVEDLGSANGTRVRDQPVPARSVVHLELGDAIRIGSTVLIVQRSRWSPGSRRLWSHLHFEALLRHECARAEVSGGRFALLRLRIEGPAPWTRVFPILAREIGSPHLLGVYGPNEYEALLLEPNEEAVKRLVEALQAGLNDAQACARTGVAFYPRDGRSADALLARANALLRPGTGTAKEVTGLFSSSLAMRRVYESAIRAAATNINIIVLGETGVGKEVLARAIHRASPRASKPLVTLNCAGLPESLIEAELFGNEKGAFTGAVQARPGLLEAADGGTVFLDEIGEMPLKVQAALLRSIETREVMPVGARRPRSIDVRFIAATNRDLEAETVRANFRQDLFFRLNGISLAIPPLRERPSEIRELAHRFLESFVQENCRGPNLTISDAAMAVLERYAWPGNIRELKNVIERAVVLSDGPEILPAQLPLEKMRPSAGDLPPPEPAVRASVAAPVGPTLSGIEVRALEKRRIIDALATCAGNQTRAAKLLGIPRRTLIAKLDLHGIPRPQKMRREA